MHEIAGALGAVVVGLLVVPAVIELLQQHRHQPFERAEYQCACGRQGWNDRCRPLSRSSSPRALPLPPRKRPAETWDARLARRVVAMTRMHRGYEPSTCSCTRTTRGCYELQQGSDRIVVDHDQAERLRNALNGLLATGRA